MEVVSPPSLVSDKDREHLKLLAVFHYIVAGLGALFATFPLLHVAVGAMMVLKPEKMGGQQSGGPSPEWVGYFFIIMGGMFVLTGWAAAICTFLSGRFLARRRKRMFSFVMAALLCGFFPFGTALGVFTIIVLSRESVRRLYEAT